MRWQLRFLRNAAIALLPGQEWLRRAKRAIVPYDGSLDEWTFEQGLRMIGMLRESQARVDGGVFLELGSGWKPTIPLLLRAVGARQVFLTDAQRLLDARLLRDTAKALSARSDVIAKRLGLEADEVKSRLDVGGGHDVDSAAASIGFSYLAPVDACSLPILDGTIDVVVSRAVLEHIQPAVVRRLFEEFRRLLRPESGRMCHIIDNSDHLAHFDPRLNKLNFLRYSERRWRWFAINSIDCANRLRHSDYLEILRAAGFALTIDRSTTDVAALEGLTDLPIAAPFAGRSMEDLAVLTSYIVAAPYVGSQPEVPFGSTLTQRVSSASNA